VALKFAVSAPGRDLRDPGHEPRRPCAPEPRPQRAGVLPDAALRAAHGLREVAAL
jgi:hypothetical protein